MKLWVLVKFHENLAKQGLVEMPSRDLRCLLMTFCVVQEGNYTSSNNLLSNTLKNTVAYLKQQCPLVQFSLPKDDTLCLCNIANIYFIYSLDQICTYASVNEKQVQQFNIPFLYRPDKTCHTKQKSITELCCTHQTCHSTQQQLIV